MRLIHLDIDKNIKCSNKINPFLAPDYIYLPIKKPQTSIKRNKIVKKGELLFSKEYSSVSGKIIDIVDCSTNNKKNAKCLKIANDFKETIIRQPRTRQKTNEITKEDLLKNLKDIDLKKFSFNIKKIIISGIDNEPYIENEKIIQKENTKMILETIDMLLKVYDNAKAVIVLKTTDEINIEKYTNYLGTYENIELCLVEDLYLIGEEEFLISKLHYQKEYLYLKASEIYQIYHNVILKKPIFEKYLTITGNGIEKTEIFIVKIGTKIKDILDQYYNIDFIKYDIYINGLMKGYKSIVKDLIVTKELDGIIIMKKEENPSKSCINCGKCLEICPIHSNPLNALKYGKKIKCINCGLCSYICPSYINFSKYLNGDKDE